MSKKIISSVMSLLVLVSFFALSTLCAGAQEEITEVVLDGETYNVPVGSTFVFETKVTMPDYAAAGGRVVLKFDVDKLAVVSSGSNADIYETDLGGALAVAGYTADGEGCSFAFASTGYSASDVLSGDKNTLVRFFFMAKSAGTAEIVFDSDSYDLNVFAKQDETTPVAVVSAGKETGELSGYTFAGNSITVEDFEFEEESDPQQAEPDGSDSSATVSDSGFAFDVSGTTAVIKGGNANAAKLVIPETVTDENGNTLSVTEIADGAFLNSAATEIYIPASVTVIPDYSVGYVFEDGEYKKIEGFTIYGHKGSAAEEYANANGFTFVDADETPIETESADKTGDNAGTGNSTAVIIAVIAAAVIICAAAVIILLVKRKSAEK